jgi:hypothetical protein
MRVSKAASINLVSVEPQGYRRFAPASKLLKFHIRQKQDSLLSAMDPSKLS